RSAFHSLRTFSADSDMQEVRAVAQMPCLCLAACHRRPDPYLRAGLALRLLARYPRQRRKLERLSLTKRANCAPAFVFPAQSQCAASGRLRQSRHEPAFATPATGLWLLEQGLFER